MSDPHHPYNFIKGLGLGMLRTVAKTKLIPTFFNMVKIIQIELYTTNL